MALQDFTVGYIICALWSSNDENDEPLDRNYSINDIHPDTLKLMEKDCKAFYDVWWYAFVYEGLMGTKNDEYAGHDFWLTRNRHGAGFWDRDKLLNRDKLTKASKAFGEFDLWVGDHVTYGNDNKIHGVKS